MIWIKRTDKREGDTGYGQKESKARRNRKSKEEMQIIRAIQ
ncbi:MAG: hypothetical protein ACFFBS_08415 [Promethearchaeota archaeon]